MEFIKDEVQTWLSESFFPGGEYLKRDVRYFSSAVIDYQNLSIVRTRMVLATCRYSKRPYRQQTTSLIVKNQAEDDKKLCISQSIITTDLSVITRHC